MNKVALYSSSSRTRRPDPPDEAVSPDPAAAAAAAAAPAAPGRLRRAWQRHERPLLVVAGALFAVALVVTYAKTRPAATVLTQKDIDAAVLHTLENNPLPAMAARAYAAIEPSVVRVTGIGPDTGDDEDEGGAESGKGKDAGKGKGPAAEKGRDAAKDKGKGAPKDGDKVARGDAGKDKPADAPKDRPADSGKGRDSPSEFGKDGRKNPHGTTGVGTGVVIVDKGIILTNLHVVLGAEKIMVRFFDGMESEATVIGVRPEHDLAVLQAKSVPDDLVSATLRSTADLQVGDHVVAVGFPFGIGPSASAGVVSGLKREYHSPQGKRVLTNLIQFDAAANPGNSGGPLVTADGEVVGIVTGILNPTAQRVFIGIGFAVPIENAAAAVGMSPF